MKSQQAALEATSPDRQKDQRKSDKAKNQDSKESLRKRITRKWLLPFFENRICKSHPDGAQMARYILHTKCGLTDDQAKALRDYFTSYEALGLAIQRGEWLSAECDRIKGRLDKKTGGEDSADTTRLTVEFREIWNEVRKNRMVTAWLAYALQVATAVLGGGWMLWSVVRVLYQAFG
ncbi:hypothetical protein BJY04DRAFT_219279 [Aspergillus karnatakaensis]|uniref:uncharacterized protein n=1 Tax=Aspergillus karnatakaensis TaxID=1810916 RepID=UPI003CCE01DC